MEFRRKVTRIEKFRVGVDARGRVGHVVDDESHALGNRTRHDVGSRDACSGGCERRGDVGSPADAHLDDGIESPESG